MTEVWQEPARGGFPPQGFESLSGIERMRALVQGLVPRPPLMRLFGIRPTHASVGAATFAMPASPWLSRGWGTIEIIPLASQALGAAAVTTVAPGVTSGLQLFSINYVRRPSTDMESFVARGRCLAAGPSRATTEAHIEDADGRLVAQATGQIVFGPARVSGAAPVLEPVVEPAYPTPDPPVRPVPPEFRPAPGTDGLSVLHELAGDRVRIPHLWELTGLRIVDFEAGACTVAMPASEWLRNRLRSFPPAVFATLLNAGLSIANQTELPDDRVFVDHHLHSAWTGNPQGHVADWAPEDIGEFVVRARVSARSGDGVFATGEVFIGDEQVMAGSSATTFIERPDAEPVASTERVLAAVLYTDIVGSTPRAETMGDAKWRELLEELRERWNNHVVSFRGREVKWTGDGILATFDSPARAVQCAQAIGQSARHHGITIRSGLHVGECELMGADVAGIAVHVAQRVLDKAEPGTIFVTSTVREAAAGSGLRFSDRGRHALKGIEGDWQLFAVDG